MPFHLITRYKADTVPIHAMASDLFAAWHAVQPERVRNWLRRIGFAGDAGCSAIVPGDDGRIACVVFCHESSPEPTAWSALAEALRVGSYRLETEFDPAAATDTALGWALAGYVFTRYGKTEKPRADLVWPKGADRAHVLRTATATALVRDLINTPADDMGPSELATAARRLARQHRAKLSVTAGDRLLKAGYPAIHAVGRASDDAPRLIDLRWGNSRHRKVTLVGKGVCFDTGGLDLKPAGGMKLMKKDMGGAAHVLGLAHMIMDARLPIRLRVLIAAVENAVAGNAYRPLDVVDTRKGLTVEIGNTDAEGRVVLSDCLHEGCSEAPELLVDFATLTGAARVALGPDLPALFSNDDAIAEALLATGRALRDPLWRMPLHQPYRQLLDSKVADLNNISDTPYAGAVTAALFLQAFVGDGIPWCHIDVMAWNTSSRPGRPEGGEAMGMRAVYALIAEKFAGSLA